MAKQQQPAARPQTMSDATFSDRAEPTRQISGSNVVSNQNDEFIKRREAIADAADEFRATEMVDADGDPVARRPVEEEDQPDRNEPDVVEARSEEPKRYKLTVNGREVELTEEELITRAQKVESADEYLKSAAEAVRNASTMSLSAKDETSKVEEDDLALARAIQMGSEDEAVQAIRKIKARPSEVTPDAVARVVDERLSFQRAAEWFNGEYKDLLADPLLKKLVLERDSELANTEPGLPYVERLKRVGEEIRGWKQKLTGAPASTAKPNKEARKAAVANVPSAAGRQSAGGDEEVEDTPENVIAMMAKARGQGRSVQH